MDQQIAYFRINRDSAPEATIGPPGTMWQEGDFLDAQNVRILSTDSGRGATVQSVKGNLRVDYPLPPGTNTVVGFREVKDKSCVYLVHNSLGNHLILQYRYEIGNFGKIYQVGSGPGLGLSGVPVTGITVVDFTLEYTDPNTGLYSIDITKGITENKKEEIEIYFPPMEDGSTGRQYTVTITENGVTSPPFILFSTTTAVEDMALEFSQGWNVSPGFTALQSEACGNYVALTATTDGSLYTISVLYDEYDGPTVVASGACHVQPVNIYIENTSQVMQLGPLPPLCTPTVELMRDPDYKANFIISNTFQFALRYRYDNGAKSLSGPYSQLVVGNYGCQTGGADANMVRITFNDSRLSDPEFLCVLRYVDVMYRNLNTGQWKIADTLYRDHFSVINHYDFYNDQVGTVMDQAEAMQVQNALPILAGCMESAVDRTATRLFVADVVEGYDNPCINARTELSYSGSGAQAGITGNITGKIYIYNPFTNNPTYANSQPIVWYGPRTTGGTPASPNPGYTYGGYNNSFSKKDTGVDYGQWIPEGGFTVYLAGTDYFDISEQIVPTVTTLLGDVTPNTVAGTNVYDASQAGGAINIQNRTYSAAVRVAIENNPGSVWSEFSIQAPPGTYILRVASPWCSYGDKISKGDKYDLDNGREYQKTSCPVLSVGTVFSANVIPGTYECIVTIPPTGGTVDIGTISVMDNTDPDPLTSTFVYQGYLFDNLGQADSVNEPIRDVGITMENQLTIFKSFDIGGILLNFVPLLGIVNFINPAGLFTTADALYNSGTCYTDHNGFFFYANSRNPILAVGNVRAYVCGASGDAANPIGSVINTTLAGIFTSNLQILQDSNDPYYEGGLGGSLVGTSGSLGLGAELKEYIFYNHNATASTNILTYLVGNVLTSTGLGVKGVLVTYGRGKYDRTDTNGAFRIPAWADVLTDRRITDSVYLIYDGICGVELIAPTTHLANISQYDNGQPYSRNRFYTVPDFLATVTTQVSQSWIKRGGIYRIAFTYRDIHGRTTFPVTSERLKVVVPHINQEVSPGVLDRGRPSVTVLWQHDVPEPEHGEFIVCHILMTENLAASTWLQWVANKVEYVERYNNGSPVVVGYDSAAAKEIYIGLEPSLTLYQEENSASRVAYSFTPGDKMVVIADSNGNYYDTHYEVEVLDYREGSIVIEAQESLPELKYGMLFEVFTPSREDVVETYYEVGCFPILPGPVHSVNTYTIGVGDCYYYPRRIPIEPDSQILRLSRSCESPYASDFFSSTAWSRGRALVAYPDARQENLPVFIRFSDSYQQDTQINGLGRFAPGNGSQVSSDMGIIRKLVYVGEVLLVIGTNGSLTIYIGKVQINSITGSSFAGLTDATMGSQRTLMQDFGTLHPESVARLNNYVYWWDGRTGNVVRYAGDGLNSISAMYAMRSYFSELARQLDGNTDLRVTGAVDEYHGEYIVSFQGTRSNMTTAAGSTVSGGVPVTSIQTIPSVTWAFNEQSNAWVGRYSFTPEYMGKVSNRLVSFLSGELWLHDANEQHGTFYGVFSAPSITVVAAAEPAMAKIWMNLSILPTGEWSCPSISNEEGQESSLIWEDFEEWYGKMNASFLFDTNTTGVTNPLLEGDGLMSRILRIKFQATSDNYSEIRGIFVRSIENKLNF